MSNAQSDRPLSILTVCSHNRTRSVMMAALLESMLADRFGDGRATVQSSGFGPLGLPPIRDAVDAMRRRGLDVSQHGSSATTDGLVDAADLILTAERDHVVRISALSSDAFGRAMTLPEFLATAHATVDVTVDATVDDDADDPTAGAADRLRRWVHNLTSTRTAADYLRRPVPEVADPTGSSPRSFEAAALSIEQQCREAVAIVARCLTSRHPLDLQ